MATALKLLKPSAKAKAPAFLDCAIKLLHAHRFNPRGPIEPDSVTELVASVKEKGVIAPLIVVARKGSGFTVIAGHRRLLAAQLAKLKTVPIIIRALSPIEQEEMMLLENIQRENLSALQEAMAYERLIRQGVTQRDIVRKLSLSPHRVSSRLEILKLAPPVQTLFASGNDLPVTVIPHLLKVSSAARQLQFARLVAERRVTVAEMGEMVTRIERQPTASPMIVAEAESSTETSHTKRVRTTSRVEAPRPLPAGGREMSDYSQFFSRPVAEPHGHLPIPTGKRVSYTHEDARRDLLQREGRFWTRDHLLLALEAVCGSNGLNEVCGECPLPSFLRALTKAWD